jgi:ATP-binding cassette, subfamily B, bacterial PglK
MRHVLSLLTTASGTKRLVQMALLTTAVAVLEAIGATLVFVFLQVALDSESAIELPVIGDIRSLVPTLEDQRGVLWLTIFLGGFFVFQAGVRIGEAYVEQRYAHGAAATLSVRLIEGYLSLPYEFHLDRNSAELIRNAHDAVQKLGGVAFLPFIRLFAESFVLVGLLLVLFFSAPLASAVVVLVLIPLTLIILRVIQPRIKRLGLGAHEMAGESISVLQQSLQGVRDVSLFDSREYFVQRYRRVRLRMARSYFVSGTLAELPKAVLQTALLLFILAFFLLSTVTQRSSAESLALLGLFAYAGFRMQPSLQKIITAANHLKFFGPSAEDIEADLSRFLKHKTRTSSKPGHPLPFNHDIRLENVSYWYRGSPAPAIRELNITIDKGMLVGICGPTGGGKSTLVDLFAGLLAPSEGVVRVDGKDVQESMPEWQEKLGVVSQNIFLLDDTLRRNIAFGLRDEDIDEGALSEAVQLAQLQDYVDALPDGLDSRVGERGVKLSGGQRQRVAIARAFYRRPEVLIFDEGTSALDNVTEANLVRALRLTERTRTIILVAHRLSTVRDCDTVFYLDDGRILAQGSFEELLATSQAFRDLAVAGRNA